MRAAWRPRLQLYSHQEGECRIWDGPANKDGYGVFTYVDPGTGRRRSMGAHKAAFLASGGVVPPGQVVRHVTCHRTLCIEPQHLAAGTQKQNLEDRKETGTWNRRSGSTRAKTAKGRKERLAAMRGGITAKEFAARFGVGENAAFQWLRRWRRKAGESRA